MVGFLARVVLVLVLAVGTARASEAPPEPVSDSVEVSAPALSPALRRLRAVRTTGLVITWGAAVPLMVGGYWSLIAMEAQPISVGARVAQVMVVVGPPLLFGSALAASGVEGAVGSSRRLALFSALTYGGCVLSMLGAEALFRSQDRTTEETVLGVMVSALAILFGVPSLVTGSIASLRATRLQAPRAMLVPALGPDRYGLAVAARF